MPASCCYGARVQFTSRAWLLALLVSFAALPACASCGQSALCSMRGTVNKPENRSLRRSVMHAGLTQFCAQMLLHNAPLRMQPEQPTIGRYFPSTCTQKEAANGDLYVEFWGVGYAWTNLSKKLAFTMSGAVQYNQDFLVPPEGDCDIYGYFRPRAAPMSDFRVTLIQAPATSFVNQYTNWADTFGRQLVGERLRSGFTVVHGESGSDEMTLGLLPLGQKPFRPVAGSRANARTYENNRTEIHQNQRDFVGPIEVTGDGEALFLKAQSDGGVPLDVLVLSRQDGDASLRLYLTYPDHGPLAGTPRWADTLLPAQPGYARTIPLPRGVYYVVFDNTPSAGQNSPPQNPLDDRAVLVDYSVQVGTVVP
jgi:hypothetical protein